jgi:hypothetical protein
MKHVRRPIGVYLVSVEQLDRVNVFVLATGTVAGIGMDRLFSLIFIAS